ncbi:unnamed protein product [Enterobius vermicularis]|uniref:Uncharacterized protein n=1 Tax=Enterobius vermicularis TaxID=51028 RepID=A0A0N4V4K9_ENTVE|nr:unnamed protein product [Enterobius vermicularis]
MERKVTGLQAQKKDQRRMQMMKAVASLPCRLQTVNPIRGRVRKVFAVGESLVKRTMTISC